MRNDVIQACRAEISNLLEVKWRYNAGILSINEIFSGWIGLGIGVHRTYLRLNPNIGIHSSPVMRAVACAYGEKYRAGEFPTLIYPLGEAAPHVQEFIFENANNIQSESRRLAQAVMEFGVQFIHGLANDAEISDKLRLRVGNLGGAPAHYIASLYLSGRKDEAIHFVKTQSEIFFRDGLINEASKIQAVLTWLSGEK